MKISARKTKFYNDSCRNEKWELKRMNLPFIWWNTEYQNKIPGVLEFQLLKLNQDKIPDILEFQLVKLNSSAKK